MEDKNLFGIRIREKRKALGLTQKDLAERVGAKHNSVSDWEKGKNKPDPDTIERLCEVFNVSASYLLPGRIDESARSDGDILYISRPSDSMEADELRKFLHELIDQMGDDDLRLMKDLTIRMKRP